MDNLNLRWVDKDHVWINGVQFISLQRTGEMIRERTEKKRENKEDAAGFPVERYRLTLRHELLTGSDAIEIDPPYFVEYLAPKNAMSSGPIAVNAMLGKMQYEILHRYGQEAAP